MEKIKWPEKITDEHVLEHIGERRTLLNNILYRKANWIGHILEEIASFMMTFKDRWKRME